MEGGRVAPQDGVSGSWPILSVMPRPDEAVRKDAGARGQQAVAVLSNALESNSKRQEVDAGQALAQLGEDDRPVFVRSRPLHYCPRHDERDAQAAAGDRGDTADPLKETVVRQAQEDARMEHRGSDPAAREGEADGRSRVWLDCRNP